MHYLKSMRNIFRQGGRAKASLTLLLILAIAVGGVFVYQKVFAAPGITIAAGGTNISLDTSLSAPGASYTNLTNISIAESTGGEIGLGWHTFTLPDGFRFDPSSTITIGADWSTGFSLGHPNAVVPQAITGYKTFKFNVTAQSNGTVPGPDDPVTVNLSGLRIQPTGTTPASGIITHSGATITGVDGSTSFGSVS